MSNIALFPSCEAFLEGEWTISWTEFCGKIPAEMDMLVFVENNGVSSLVRAVDAHQDHENIVFRAYKFLTLLTSSREAPFQNFILGPCLDCVVVGFFMCYSLDSCFIFHYFRCPELLFPC